MIDQRSSEHETPAELSQGQSYCTQEPKMVPKGLFCPSWSDPLCSPPHLHVCCPPYKVLKGKGELGSLQRGNLGRPEAWDECRAGAAFPVTHVCTEVSHCVCVHAPAYVRVCRNCQDPVCAFSPQKLSQGKALQGTDSLKLTKHNG